MGVAMIEANPNDLMIGRLAKEAGVNVQTLRYYERRGLLPSPDRTASNYRIYPVTPFGGSASSDGFQPDGGR